MSSEMAENLAKKTFTNAAIRQQSTKRPSSLHSPGLPETGRASALPNRFKTSAIL